MTTQIHEASHVAAALTLGRSVDHVLVEVGLARVGEQLGHARIPVGDRIEPSQVVICLVGYMSDGTADWPPLFRDALAESREALGAVLLRLGATEQAYEASIELARTMLADPSFVALRDRLARALSAAPRLEREDIEALASIHLSKEEPCNT